MIYDITPWDSEKNIGDAYHAHMDLLKDEDYAVFRDADTMWTTYNYGRTIEAAIRRNPDVHFFTGRTNRIACDWQRYAVTNDNNDYENHREIGNTIERLMGTRVMDCTNKSPWSGFLMVIKKESWHGIKMRKGILGVDNDIFNHAKKIGQKVYLMLGVYMYHYYSNYTGKAGNMKRNKNHLI